MYCHDAIERDGPRICTVDPKMQDARCKMQDVSKHLGFCLGWNLELKDLVPYM